MSTTPEHLALRLPLRPSGRPLGWRIRQAAPEGARHLLLLLVAAAVVLPFWWVAATSLKARHEVFAPGAWFWPPSPTLEAYLQVFQTTPFSRWMLNSLVVAVAQTSGTVVIAFLAAYAFARYRFPGREVLFLGFLASMMIPPQTLLVPSYVILAELNWLNTYQGLIVPHLASAFAIFLLRQFFLTLPADLADAAAIDGAGHWGVLRHVYLPLSVPGLVAVAVITFVASWNDYFWPLLIISDDTMRTLPLSIGRFTDAELSVNWAPAMAAATLATLPVFGLYLLAQRHFIEGFATSGIKG